MTERRAWEFGGIVIDTRDWPIVAMDMPERTVPDAAVHEALSRLELVLRQTPAGAKCFQLTDLSRMKDVAPASQRKYAAEWAKRTHSLLVESCVEGAIVAAGPLLRGMLTAVFWLKAPAVPTTIVSTRSEGLLCGIRAIERASSALPAHLAQLRAGLVARPRH